MLRHMHLVNYCHRNCKPLQNIMRLPEKEAFELAARLAAENPETTAFYRFADFQNYYPRRLEADERLREAFIALGGQPVQKHPLSFVLEGSEYLDAWFDHGIVTRIPLQSVPPEHISFTLGDSMAVLARDGAFTMMTADMLAKQIAAHPQGVEGYLRDVRERFRYVEVQLWDDAPCFFAEVARSLSLGELTAPPTRLSGGYTHRMLCLETAAGCCAVKLLNPEIMQRSDALENYRTAEAFEAMLEQENLPILSAKTIAGRKMQCVDGRYLYVFDYYAGRVLPEAEITPAHCAKIGEVLARIHRVDYHECSGEPDNHAPANDWAALAAGLLAAPDALAEADLLQSAVPMLLRAAAAAEDAIRRLPPMEALCHNDMDPKNVLWQGEDFRIIDLECLGYANPLQEMLDLAIAWSAADEAKFKAFVSAYYAAGGLRPGDAALVYDSRRNYIDWLAYNAKRALSVDPEERRIGREQVRWTVCKIEDDLINRDKILRWMEEISHG